MPNKKINALDARTAVSTDLMLVGDPATGTAYKSTVANLPLVPTTRTLTINGTTQDLSADRTFTIATMAIGGAITSATQGSVLFAGASGVLTQNNANFFWDNTNSRLGIGLTSPAEKIDILGTNLVLIKTKSSTNTGASGFIAYNDLDNSFQFGMWGSTKTSYGSIASGDAFLYAGVSLGVVAIGSIKFATDSGGGSVSERMRLTAAGRLLLGTTSESTNILEIVGTARISSSLTLTSYNTGSIPFIGTSGLISQNNANFFFDNTNSRLGIGTNAPSSLLHIKSANPSLTIDITTATAAGGLSFLNSTSTLFGQIGGTGSTFSNGVFTGNAIYVASYENNGKTTIVAGGTGGFINFATGGLLAGNERMRLTSAGRLLLGTTTESTFILDVNGTARVSGAITTSDYIFSTTTYPNFRAYSPSAATHAGYQCFTNNGSGNAAIFLMYGSGGGFDLANKAAFGSQTSVVIYGSLSSVSGGTTTIALRPGGADTTASALVAYQNSVTIGANSNPVASAVLDVISTTKGFLPPRMTTTQINAIATPAEGLQVYNTTINHMCFYQNGAWAKISHSPM